jgi:biopolymer transport protein ExbB/TolQ
MKQVNPLHIILLLIVVLIFAFFKLGEVKKELRVAKDAYVKSEQLAQELHALKRVYGDKTALQKKLQKIVSSSALRKEDLKSRTTKEGFIISSQSLSVRGLNTLMSKILNGNFPIKKLEIKKADETHATLLLEITW